MTETIRRSARCAIPCLVLLAVTCVTPRPLAAQDGEAPAGSRGDAEVALTRGVLAFHDEDFEAAREHLAEAVRLDPGDGTARHWLGLTLLHLDRPAEAKRELRAALDARHPPAAPRDEVREHLAEAERRSRGEAGTEGALAAPGWAGEVQVLPRVPRIEGRLSLAVGSDSNPNLMPEELVLVTPDGEAVEGEESDAVALGDVRIAFQRQAGERRSYGVVLRGTQSLHDDFGHLDLGRAEAVAFLALGRDPLGYLSGPLGYARTPLGAGRFALLLQAGASKDWLDGEGLADRLMAGASLTWNQARRGQTRLSTSFRDVDFDDDPEGPLEEILARGGETVEAELAQFLYFGRRNRYLLVAVSTSDRDAGAAFDSSSLRWRGELSLPFATRWTLYLSGAHRTDEYDEPVSNLFDPFGEPREDEELRLGGALLLRATERLFVTGRLTWIDHDVDLPAGFATPDLSYERTLASVGVSWLF